MTATSNVQNSAQTGTDGCVRKQNTDNEQFLPASIQFSIGFHQRTYTKRKIISNFCRLANGQFRITQRLSRLSHFIFQSTFFQVNISTNKLLVYSLKKFHHVWFLSLHCTGFNCGEVFILCLEEKVRISATSSSPLAKRHPVFTLHGKDFALKLDPFPTICNAMLPHFPSPHCSIACWENFEWNWKVYILDICTEPKCFKNFNWKNWLDTKCFNLGSK